MKNLIIIILILLFSIPSFASTREERKQRKATSVEYVYDVNGNLVNKIYVYDKKLTKKQKANRKKNIQKYQKNPVKSTMPKYWRSKK